MTLSARLPRIRSCRRQRQAPRDRVAPGLSRRVKLPDRNLARKLEGSQWLSLLAVARQESSAFSAVLGDPIPAVDASILAGKPTKTKNEPVPIKRRSAGF